MRKGFLITGLMAAFAFAVLASSAAANFAGTWSLDKVKSQGLSPRMQNADSVVWTITQNDKTISVETKVTGGQPPAGGGMGGGRGPGGGAPQVYNLDGSETSSDVSFGQAPGKATRKVTWSGNVLELSRKTTFQGPNGEVTNSSTQKLSLSGDGKMLTVNQHSEGLRGTQDSTLVFNKQ